MSTKEIKQINTELSALKREVRVLRSLVVGTSKKDPEGEYKPSFVREMKKRMQEKPIGELKSLKEIRSRFS